MLLLPPCKIFRQRIALTSLCFLAFCVFANAQVSMTIHQPRFAGPYISEEYYKDTQLWVKNTLPSAQKIKVAAVLEKKDGPFWKTLISPVFDSLPMMHVEPSDSVPYFFFPNEDGSNQIVTFDGEQFLLDFENGAVVFDEDYRVSYKAYFCPYGSFWDSMSPVHVPFELAPVFPLTLFNRGLIDTVTLSATTARLMWNQMHFYFNQEPTYNIKVYKVEDGQTPSQAVSLNAPLTDTVLQIPYFLWERPVDYNAVFYDSLGPAIIDFAYTIETVLPPGWGSGYSNKSDIHVLSFQSLSVPRFADFGGDTLQTLAFARRYGFVDHTVYTVNAEPAIDWDTVYLTPNVGQRTIPCANAGFEDGTFTDYNGGVGQNEGEQTETIEGIIADNRPRNHHYIVHTSHGNDMYTDMPMVPPGGGSHAARLNGYGADAYVYRNVTDLTFNLKQNDAEGPVFTFKFAVVLLRPHEYVKKLYGGPEFGYSEWPDSRKFPYFKIVITDRTTSEVLLNTERQYAGGNFITQGFDQSNLSHPVQLNWKNAGLHTPPGAHPDNKADIMYLDWQCLGLKMEGLVGHDIEVKFEVGGSHPAGYWGYAYLDGFCDENEPFAGFTPPDGDFCPFIDAPIYVDGSPSESHHTHVWTIEECDEFGNVTGPGGTTDIVTGVAGQFDLRDLLNEDFPRFKRNQHYLVTLCVWAEHCGKWTSCTSRVIKSSPSSIDREGPFRFYYCEGTTDVYPIDGAFSTGPGPTEFSTYSWSPTAGVSDSTIPNPLINPQAPEYKLTVTTPGQCPATFVYKFVEAPDPTVSIRYEIMGCHQVLTAMVDGVPITGEDPRLYWHYNGSFYSPNGRIAVKPPLDCALLRDSSRYEDFDYTLYFLKCHDTVAITRPVRPFPESAYNCINDSDGQWLWRYKTPIIDKSGQELINRRFFLLSDPFGQNLDPESSPAYGITDFWMEVYTTDGKFLYRADGSNVPRLGSYGGYHNGQITWNPAGHPVATYFITGNLKYCDGSVRRFEHDCPNFTFLHFPFGHKKCESFKITVNR